ncbi:MAG: hypothetical protein JWL65_3063 [Gammaproteobacteria bacterium]|nr:hypothetical protein [Gammaproteobacteria bacterium]
MRMKNEHVVGYVRGWAVASLVVLGAGAAARATATDPAYTPTMKDMMSIQTALEHYHQGLDKHDNHLMASAFSEDGTLILEAPDHQVKINGRDQIASKGLMPPGAPPVPATGAQAPASGGPQGATAPPADIWHYSANDYYEFESPTRVRHSAYWLDVIPGTGREATVGTPGRYEDILVKRNAEWLFLERKIIVGRK